MTAHISLRTISRAAIIASALSITALAAAPAQAAPPPANFGLTLQLGSGGGGMGISGGGITLQFGNGPSKVCLTNKQIRYQLLDEGWEKPQIVKELSTTKVLAVANWYGDWYQMRVDRCTGKVDKVKPLPPPTSNGKFSITLSF